METLRDVVNIDIIAYCSWAKGYKGGKAYYINEDVVCYKCGNNIKFVGEDGQETLHSFEGDGIGPISVCGIYKVFAYAEICVNPKIHVIQYPSFIERAVLAGMCKLCISCMLKLLDDYEC